MASFFNMKGTTQSDFMIGIKGPILQKYVYSDVTYLLLPANTVGRKIILNQTDITKYIDEDNYTGNAATATKLKTANIGLDIVGLSISHSLPNEATTNSGLSDGSGKIRGSLLSIDASKLVKSGPNGTGNGVPYAVLSDLVVTGDLNATIENSGQKIASANHTHSQYLTAGANGFSLTTKDGETELGKIKINNSNETASPTAEDPQKIKLNLTLRNGSVTEVLLANGAVTADKLGEKAVTNAKLDNGAITPAKLAALISDGNGGYSNGDYSGQIAKVVSANKLNLGGSIAGIPISDILTADTQNPTQLTSVIKSAFNAYNVYDKATANSKTAAQIIAAVGKVEAASATKSTGNLVLWTENGITGNLTGNVTGNLTGNASSASEAAKLTTAKSLWGNSFNGTADIGTSTTAANISNTGHVTPQANDTYSLGESGKKYKNAYLSGTLYSKDITNTNIITTHKLTFGNNAAGIDLNNADITNANTITATTFASTGSSVIGTRDKPFSTIFVSNASAIMWPGTSANSTITLKGELDNKANVDHSHDISKLTAASVGTDGYVSLTNTTIKLATQAHKHHMSDIEDIAGVYQFKGTVQQVDYIVSGDTKKINLNGISTPQNGDVYNVITAFEYNGEQYPAGTNIVYEKDINGTTVDGVTTYSDGEWKPLGGSFNVNLGDYITKVEAVGLLDPATSVPIIAPDGRTLVNNIPTGAANRAIGIRLRGLFENRERTTNEIENNIIPNQLLDFYLPRATATVFGLFKSWDPTSTDYTNNRSEQIKNYGVLLDDAGRAYVNVDWINTDTVNRYNLITTNSTYNDGMAETTTSSLSEGKTNFSGTGGNDVIQNGDVYIKLLHDDDNNTRVAKRIRVVGSGDVSVRLSNDANSGMDAGSASTLSIDVPKRSGYSIPIIKCMSEPRILDEETDKGDGSGTSNVFLFSANSDIYSENGVYNCNDGNKIKDGSLVLLYLNHIDKLYNARNYMNKKSGYKNGVTQIKINLPGSVFNYEYSLDSVTFVLTTPERESKYMYFADLSKKLFLCQINIEHGNNTISADMDCSVSGSTIKILEDVGHTFNEVSIPEVFMRTYRYAGQAEQYFTLKSLSDALGGVIRRYNGIADVIVRTLFLGHRGMYVPMKDLDVNLTELVINPDYKNMTNLRYPFGGRYYYDNHERINKLPYHSLYNLYSRKELIQNICYTYDEEHIKVPITDSTPVRDIIFKGDEFNVHSLKKKKQNIGIRKKSGNILLDKLQIQDEKKLYKRDYTKIKFQFVLHFKSSELYDIRGDVSEDEYTMSKSSSQKVGLWGIIIKNNSK